MKDIENKKKKGNKVDILVYLKKYFYKIKFVKFKRIYYEQMERIREIVNPGYRNG